MLRVTAFTLTGLTVLRPIRLESDSPRDLRVTLTRQRDGSQRIEARIRETAGWALAVEAEVTPLTDNPGKTDTLAQHGVVVAGTRSIQLP